MSRSAKDIKELEATDKKQTLGCGNGLYIVIESSSKGGGKSFIGRYKNKEVRIGVYPNAYSLSSAQQKWFEIKTWAKDYNKSVNEYKTIKKRESEVQETIGDAIDAFLLKKKGEIKETTHREYRMKLYNQVLSKIDRNTPLNELEWRKGFNKGRRIIQEIIDTVEEGGKYDLSNRCQSLLSRTFAFAISKGWMDRGTNPAEKQEDERIKHRPKHHCSITWNQVPSLLKKINRNEPNAQIQKVLATKLLLMTFLRAGALTRLQWDWVDWEKKLITIPGTTPGLKRYRDLSDHIPHYIPITPAIERVLKNASEFSAGKKFIFQPLMKSRYPHLDPSAPNNYLRGLGYKGILRAHGWRTVALTYGQDILEVNNEVIQRQMSHLPHKKGVRGHYDNSERLEERRDFLDRWCSALEENGLRI